MHADEPDLLALSAHTPAPPHHYHHHHPASVIPSLNRCRMRSLQRHQSIKQTHNRRSGAIHPANSAKEYKNVGGHMLFVPRWGKHTISPSKSLL